MVVLVYSEVEYLPRGIDVGTDVGWVLKEAPLIFPIEAVLVADVAAWIGGSGVKSRMRVLPVTVVVVDLLSELVYS